MRLAVALCLVSLPRARCLLGTAAPPTEASPESVERVLQPAITFTLAAEPAAAEQAGAEDDWRRLARTVAQLQQLECTEDVLGAQVHMVDAAEQGDRLAMAALGSMFLLGQDCARKRNLTWGYHWLSRAVELEQPDALALMGFLHTTDVLRDLYNFTAVTHDRTEGIRLLQRGAAGGSPFANLAMGFRYMAGAGVVESCPTSGVYYEAAALSAREWLDLRRQRSVEQSNPTEQEHLTLLARNMPPRDKMDAANVEYIDYCAAIGDVQGQLGMGQLLHAGSHGVTQDRGAAAHWFRSAAALGEGMGHANDGMMRLREGRDAAGAVRALRRAAKLQDPSGWAGLAYAHLYGAGVKQSDEMAARAMCMAAQSGHLDSIFNIGVLWLQGRGVAKRDVRKAFHCFSVAAEFSHAHAQLHVGRMALRGLGVRKNCQTAQFFLKHAAEQGGVVRSLMSTALAAHDAGSTQRASLHYLLAAHAGVEAAQANAGYLYAHELTRLRPEQAALFKQKAALLLQQAAVQGSTDAQVQLGVLLAQPPGADHALANKLLLEAAQSGSRDALFHLGYAHMHGHGVAANTKLAWEYFARASFVSRHARLSRAEAATLRLAKGVYEARALLLIGAALGLLVSSGRATDPFAMMRAAFGGGDAEPEAAKWDFEEDEFDDFSD